VGHPSAAAAQLRGGPSCDESYVAAGCLDAAGKGTVSGCFSQQVPQRRGWAVAALPGVGGRPSAALRRLRGRRLTLECGCKSLTFPPWSYSPV